MFAALPYGLRAGILLLALAPAAHAATILPRASGITVTSVTAQGAACPQNSFSSNISPDGSVITFGFDAFEAYSGPGISITEKTRNCVISLGLSYPVGDTFAVLGTAYHGMACLDANTSAGLYSTYRITSDNAADEGTLQTRATFAGELNAVVTKGVAIANGSAITSPCGRASATLQVSTRLAITSSSSASVGTLDGDPPFSLTTQQVQLGWTACKA